MIEHLVMAHEARADRARRLAETTGASIVWAEGDSIWQTARKALLAVTGDTACVLQDDALVCDDFGEATAEIVAAHPDRLVNLYLGTVKPHQPQVRAWMLAADDSGATMIEGKGPWWAVALIIPAVHIPEIISYGDAYPNAGQSYDGRLNAWTQAAKVSWLHAWPSLADHDTTIPSLHSSTPDRRAHRFRSDSPLGTDWSRVQHTDASSLHPPVKFRHVSTGRVRRVGKYSRAWERMNRHGTWEPID